jgi:hypothetical protein
MTTEPLVFQTPDEIEYFRLASLKAAVRLESIGLKVRAGNLITPQVRMQLGLKRRAPHAEVIALLQSKMDIILSRKALACQE